MTLERDYSLTEVAEALGMSYRWLHQQVRDGAAHQRYGNRIRFTSEQVDALRRRFAAGATSATAPITARRGRRSA